MAHELDSRSDGTAAGTVPALRASRTPPTVAVAQAD